MEYLEAGSVILTVIQRPWIVILDVIQIEVSRRFRLRFTRVSGDLENLGGSLTSHTEASLLTVIG